MAKKELALSMTLAAIDKTMAPLKAFNSRIERLTSPFKKVKNKLSLFKSELGIKKIEKAFSGVGKAASDVLGKVTKLTGAITGLIAAGGGIVFGIVKKAADVGDAVAKNAAKAGIAISAFQEMSYAADMAGVSQEEFSTGVRRLNVELTNAASGNKESLKWFKRAGIDIFDTNGNLKKADQVIEEVADTFSKFPDGPKKSALAMKLFGRAGVQMIPLLNGGTQSIKDARLEAIELGGILSDDVVRSGEEFNNNLSRIKYIVDGLINQVGGEFLGTLSDLLVAMKEWMLANRELLLDKIRVVIQKIIDVLRRLPEIVKSLWEKIKALGSGIAPLLKRFGNMRMVLLTLGGIIFGPLLASVAALIAALVNLGMILAASPIGLFVLAVIGAAALIYAAWDPIVAYFKGVMDRIKSAFKDGFVMGVVRVLHEFDPVALVSKYFNALFEYFTGIDLMSEGIRIMNSLLEGLRAKFAAITDFVSGVVDKVKSIIPDWLKKAFGGGKSEVTVNSITSPQLTTPGESYAAPIANAFYTQGATSSQSKQGEVKVSVDFQNVPKDTKIETKSNDVDFDMTRGWSRYSGF